MESADCSYYYYTSLTTYFNHHPYQNPSGEIAGIQNHFPSPESPISIPVVHHPTSLQSSAAAKIQSAYRSHRIKTLIRKVRALNSEADRLERLIQSQDTVDAVRRDERERLRLNEGLMAVLLQLDSVPGIDPAVRERRRNVSRRIVALQQVLDAVSEEPLGEEGFPPASWEEIVGVAGIGEGRGERESPAGQCCLERLGFWVWGDDGENANIGRM